ncbi:urea amidolyase related protein [Alkaliphilus metalliredigens QYMF]|uniref:Urea amidolyase related protein n=1 Tax=Alkaliphilus metalliredigens (strain QYMF) TaxID=293826 RepID=A6TSF4_ALKMQ|nr:biotin-dependent carboxyltransferase family protein [Alkaliphilus metalliredigens]ABR49122.1 urea amidolyase related protein [Alkaliphilus metalliredigens QYMF]
MGNIKIFKPGMLTLVQDSGRQGYQQYGVPVSGVMDSFSHRVANILVGNHETESVLEATLLGPGIEFLDETVIAITGGDLAPNINGAAVPLGQSITVKAGEKLDFKGIKTGCRCYIAFAGGINVPEIMGSKSTYNRGSIGGYEGRALKAGDILNLGEPLKPLSSLEGRTIQQDLYTYTNKIELRVVAGPQEEAFSPEGIETFYSFEYAVTNECDRMGYRLSGDVIKHKEGGDIISDGIAMGAIQVPGHGMPIIMMADRQTTGGYTKIANVISADLPKMGQAKPGDKITFKKVTIEEAQRIYKDMEDKIAEYKKTFEEQELYKKKLFQFKMGGKLYGLILEEIKE